MSGVSAKRVIIIAGPNGAGKTTFAREFLPNEANLPRFINADLIAAGLAPFAPETAAFKAGRLMLEQLETSTRRGESFAFESTLSGLGYLQHIARWRAQGYRISLYFLSLSDVETAIARVATRVRQGGHDISVDVIRRRFDAGLRNFDERYRDFVDDWTLYDNTGIEPVVLEWGVTMQQRDLSKAKYPDQRGSLAAMRRAAHLARQAAIQTGTEIVVLRDGKLVRITAEQLSAGEA